MRSPEWSSTAFVLTYDSWGGWYDHVRPPTVDRYGYGFRVPALLVSPYARHGAIDHTTLDFTSILRFIEDNWHLAPLAQRDASANSIASAFDFSAPPRAAEIVPTSRQATPGATVHTRGRVLGIRRRVPARAGRAGLGPRDAAALEPAPGGRSVRRVARTLAPLVLLLAAAPPVASAASHASAVVTVQTVPAVSGLSLTFENRRYVTDAGGRVLVPRAPGVSSTYVRSRTDVGLAQARREHHRALRALVHGRLRVDRGARSLPEDPLALRRCERIAGPAPAHRTHRAALEHG